VGLTGLDDQNTKQAPIPENPEELIEGGEEVSVHDGKEGIVARTRGAVLSISQRTKKGSLTRCYSHLGYVWWNGRQG
jgi:hypothetical protein